MMLGRSAVLVSALVVGALLTTGSTYAAFSDYTEITDNQAGAETVVIGGPGGPAPALNYSGLLPGGSAIDAVPVQYAGSIPADVWVELGPGASGAAFCDSGSAKPGGAVQVQVNGGGWVDYCTALAGHHFPIAGDVAPATSLALQVDVQVVDGTDVRYSDLSGVGDLVVRALQTGGQGFSDYTRGTISIGIGSIAPDVPQQCLAAGLSGFDASNTIVLTDGDDVFDVGKLPDHGRGYLIIALGGDDVITGSNQADCIIGGPGDDHLVGGNQSDVLLGGDGDDVLGGSGSGDGADDKAGGNGRDQLFGEGGDDELHGANGKDLLDGGDDVGGDICVDTRGGNGSAENGSKDKGSNDETAEDDTALNDTDPGGNGKDTVVNCEGDGTPPAVVLPSATEAVEALDRPGGEVGAGSEPATDDGEPKGGTPATGAESTTAATAGAPTENEPESPGAEPTSPAPTSTEPRLLSKG